VPRDDAVPDESTAEDELSFEQALSQLERIVAGLERGEPELTTALANYEKGVRLLTQCHRLLDQAEQSIALLTGVDDEGNPRTTPFDATATIAKESASAAPAGAQAAPNQPKKQKQPDRSSVGKNTTPVSNDFDEDGDPPF
jgi:exodeoxyribonuclease VII small subunit